MTCGEKVDLGYWDDLLVLSIESPIRTYWTDKHRKDGTSPLGCTKDHSQLSKDLPLSVTL